MKREILLLLLFASAVVGSQAVFTPSSGVTVTIETTVLNSGVPFPPGAQTETFAIREDGASVSVIRFADAADYTYREFKFPAEATKIAVNDRAKTRKTTKLTPDEMRRALEHRADIRASGCFPDIAPQLKPRARIEDLGARTVMGIQLRGRSVTFENGDYSKQWFAPSLDCKALEGEMRRDDGLVFRKLATVTFGSPDPAMFIVPQNYAEE